MSGALFIAIRQLVLAGLPTTSTFTSLAAGVVQRLALDGEDLAVGAEQLGALHALGARARADQQRDVGAVEGVLGAIVQVEAGEQREGAVDELHRHALQRAHRLRDLEQAQVDGLLGAQHLAAGDAEHEAVADLAGGAGDGDSYWIAHESSPGRCWFVGPSHARGACRFSSIEARNSCGRLPRLLGADRAARGPWSSCRFPPSRTHTRSSVSAKAVTSGVPSMRPRAIRPRVHAKIEAIGLVEVGLPCWCRR